MSFAQVVRFIECFALLSSLCLGLTPAEHDALAVLNAPKTADLTLLAQPESVETVQLLRAIATGKVKKIESASFSDGFWARVVLLRLGDEFIFHDTLDRYRSSFPSRGPDARIVRAMEASKQPKLIPLLAADFYRQEATGKVFVGNQMEGITYSPISVFSGIMVGRIIRESEQFSPELKQWTWKMMSLLGRNPNRFREVSIAWWEQNKARFANDEYMSVQPFDFELRNAVNAVEPKPSPSQSSQISTDSPGSVGLQMSPTTSASLANSQPASPQREIHTMKPDRTLWFKFPGMLLCISIAAGIWWWAKRGRR